MHVSRGENSSGPQPVECAHCQGTELEWLWMRSAWCFFTGSFVCMWNRWRCGPGGRLRVQLKDGRR